MWYRILDPSLCYEFSASISSVFPQRGPSSGWEGYDPQSQSTALTDVLSDA